MEQTHTIKEMHMEEIMLIKGAARVKRTTESYCIIPLGLRKQPWANSRTRIGHTLFLLDGVSAEISDSACITYAYVCASK